MREGHRSAGRGWEGEGGGEASSGDGDEIVCRTNVGERTFVAEFFPKINHKILFKHCSPETVKTQMPLVIGLRFEKSFPEQFPKQNPKLFSPPAPPNLPPKIPQPYSPKPNFCLFSVVPSSRLGGKGGGEEETGGRGVGRGKIIHTTGIIKQHAIRPKENATVFADTEARGNPGSCDNSWRLNGRLPPHRSTGPPTSRTQPSNVEGPGKPDTQVEHGAF